jgi:predicted peroxiredoxin
VSLIGLLVCSSPLQSLRTQFLSRPHTLEGVRLADTRTPQDLRWGHGDDIAKAYKAFIEAGGEVIVCPHCAKAAGFDEKSLRPGARMAKQGNDLADVIIAADKVLDF